MDLSIRSKLIFNDALELSRSTAARAARGGGARAARDGMILRNFSIEWPLVPPVAACAQPRRYDGAEFYQLMAASAACGRLRPRLPDDATWRKRPARSERMRTMCGERQPDDAKQR